MRNVLDKICRENQNTHFMFNNFFRKLHRLWDNVEKYIGDQGAINNVTIRRICVACSKSKATFTYAHAHAPGYPRTRAHTHTHTHTHRPIRSTYYFSNPTMIREGPSALHCLYIVCLVLHGIEYFLPTLRLLCIFSAPLVEFSFE
jgi:hypothetical protein